MERSQSREWRLNWFSAQDLLRLKWKEDLFRIWKEMEKLWFMPTLSKFYEMVQERKKRHLGESLK